MIKKTSKGYVVKSHTTGKTLSRPYATKAQAAKRLGQIKYFGKKKG